MSLYWRVASNGYFSLTLLKRSLRSENKPLRKESPPHPPPPTPLFSDKPRKWLPSALGVLRYNINGFSFFFQSQLEYLSLQVTRSLCQAVPLYSFKDSRNKMTMWHTAHQVAFLWGHGWLKDVRLMHKCAAFVAFLFNLTGWASGKKPFRSVKVIYCSVMPHHWSCGFVSTGHLKKNFQPECETCQKIQHLYYIKIHDQAKQCVCGRH